MNKTMLGVSVLTEVYVTKNYSLFTFLNGNREINLVNLRKIKNSLSQKQILESAIIVGEGKNGLFIIIEGQHRFIACKELNLPVSFIIREDFDEDVHEKSLNDILLLSTASTNWDVNNFLGSNIVRGSKPYMIYGEIYEAFNFEHEILFHVLNTRLKTKLNHQLFKKGELNINESDGDYLYSSLEKLDNFRALFEEVGLRYYLKAIHNILSIPNIDYGRLYKVLTTNNDFPVSRTVELAEQNIVLKYNKGLRKNGTIYISVVGKKRWLGLITAEEHQYA
jgi:hypothetical protein